MESNEGNLVADALLFQATALARSFGAPMPHVALQNGGGIRNDTIIPVGDITELTTFDILPFANFVAIVPEISPAQFKEILENAVSRVEFTDGRFAQIAGFRFVWDPAGTPQVLDAEGNVVTQGIRVREVVLDDGTRIVQGGTVVPNASALHLATIDFLARGGDQYPFRGVPFVTLGVTYQHALRTYIEEELAGIITAAQYPAEGEGRITTVDQAAAAPIRFATLNASLDRNAEGQLVAELSTPDNVQARTVAESIQRVRPTCC
jgi:5'-nucleotidase / UDP-sugar diphosphatase